MYFWLLLDLTGLNLSMFSTAFILLFVLSVAVLTLRRRLPPKKVAGGLLNLKAFRHLPYSLYVAASVVSFLGLYTSKLRHSHIGTSLISFILDSADLPRGIQH
jgi:MCP family monocarboxylic acid transporter-like MFS transporter 10